VDYVQAWSEKSEFPARRLIAWLGIARSKFYTWRERYGQVNEHNAWVPRDHWLEDWEKKAIVDFYLDHPQEGYRTLTYMMLDANVVAVSPASAYRVLQRDGLLARWCRKPSKKGTGFEQPLAAHEHWHIDVSYLNVCGTFYYLCSLLDGYSRYIVHWEIQESMKEQEVELVVQRARENFPGARPRIISDNGPQFIARDFKEFIRLCGMTHVRTSPYYPQSNGKKERWYQTLKSACLRPQAPDSLDAARRIVAKFVEHYNTTRLHGAIGYVTPKDKMEGRAEAIWATREAKLAAARQRRKARRAQAAESSDSDFSIDRNLDPTTIPLAGETEAGSAGEQPARDNRPGIGRKPPAGAALDGCSRDPLDLFGHSLHASENATVGKAVDPLIRVERLSNSG
jgi:transposase InsO family protein